MDSLDHLEDGVLIPSEDSPMRGRRKRQARRRGLLIPSYESLGDASQAIRGRHRRRLKRILRQIESHDTSGFESSVPIWRSQSTSRSLISTTRSTAAAPYSAQGTRHQQSGSSKPKTSAKGDTNDMPLWLLDSSIRFPESFREVSYLWKATEHTRALNLDLPIIEAMHIIGADKCDELLGLLMNRCDNLRLTPAGLLESMKWISVRSVKRLVEMSAIPRFTPSLVVAIVPNISNGLELLEYFVENARSSFSPELIHDLLAVALDCIVTSSWKPRSRWQKEQVQIDSFYFSRLSQRILQHLSEVQVTDNTFRTALETQATREFRQFVVTTQLLQRFLERCPHIQDPIACLQVAFSSCDLTIIELLLNRWPRQELTRQMTKELFKGINFDGYGSAFSDADKERIQDFVNDVKSRLVVDEALLVDLIHGHDGAIAVSWLRTIRSELPMTCLTTRVALSILSPEELYEHFKVDDFVWNDQSMAAAARGRPFDQDNLSSNAFTRILSELPRAAVSTQVILAAAEGISSEIFRMMLDHNDTVTIGSWTVLAALRSNHAAFDKVELIIERGNIDPGYREENFWTALIRTNHRDLVAVLGYLSSVLKPRTTDAMILAAWGASEAFPIVKILLKDPLFTLSARSISAFLREDIRDKYIKKFRFLLRNAKNFVVGSRLLMDGCNDRKIYHLLLKYHGSPHKVVVSERKLLSWPNRDRKSEYAYTNRKRCLQHFVEAGGRLCVTQRVLQQATDRCSFGEERFKEVLQLWQSQTTVSLTAFIRIATTSRHRDYAYLVILNFLLQNPMIELSQEMPQAFNAREQYRDVRLWPCNSLYDVIFQLLFQGRHQDFENMLHRLPGSNIPSQDLQKFLAILAYKGYWISDQGAEELVPYLTKTLGPFTLGGTFFESLRGFKGRHSGYEGDVKSWEKLLRAAASIDCNLASQVEVFSTQPANVVVVVMTAIGEDFVPCEKLAVAASESQEPLEKLQFIFSKQPNLEITNLLMEAAVFSGSVPALEFLMARESNFEVTNGMVEVAAHRFSSPTSILYEDEYGDNEWMSVRNDMMIYLLAQATAVNVSQAALDTAIRKLNRLVSQRLIDRQQKKDFNKATITAMLDAEWPMESILYSLRNVENRLELLKDSDTYNKAAQTEDGRALLRLVRPNEQDIERLMSTSTLVGAVTHSDHGFSLLLDQLHKASEIHLNDEQFARLWEECSATIYGPKQVMYHILEQGVSARMGHKTFSGFTTRGFEYVSRPDQEDRIHIRNRLPDLPIDIDEDLIKAANEEIHGRAAFDSILGPDYKPIIHENALVATARLGEEIWFERLLTMAQKQGLIVTNKAALVNAANEGAVRMIITACKLLRENAIVSFLPAPEPTEKQVRRCILHRQHYVVRQVRRWTRPRYLNPLRRGFRRWMHGRKMSRLLTELSNPAIGR